MSKAFTKEADTTDTDDDLPEDPPLPFKNYVTPTGLQKMQTELRQLTRDERPKIVEVVSWAAGNGDRSENGDYIYGKKRLREIDRRIRYLNKQIESAIPVDPSRQQGLEQVFFGATVTYADSTGKEHTVTLVGIDEAELSEGKISWQSPVAKALIKAQAGDTVTLRTPAGLEKLEVMTIIYRVTPL